MLYDRRISFEFLGNKFRGPEFRHHLERVRRTQATLVESENLTNNAHKLGKGARYDVR